MAGASSSDSDKPHWGLGTIEAAANFALAVEPVTGAVMKVISWAARFLDRKCDEEARRRRS